MKNFLTKIIEIAHANILNTFSFNSKYNVKDIVIECKDNYCKATCKFKESYDEFKYDIYKIGKYTYVVVEKYEKAPRHHYEVVVFAKNDDIKVISIYKTTEKYRKNHNIELASFVNNKEKYYLNLIDGTYVFSYYDFKEEKLIIKSAEKTYTFDIPEDLFMLMLHELPFSLRIIDKESIRFTNKRIYFDNCMIRFNKTKKGYTIDVYFGSISVYKAKIDNSGKIKIYRNIIKDKNEISIISPDGMSIHRPEYNYLISIQSSETKIYENVIIFNEHDIYYTVYSDYLIHEPNKYIKHVFDTRSETISFEYNITFKVADQSNYEIFTIEKRDNKYNIIITKHKLAHILNTLLRDYEPEEIVQFKVKDNSIVFETIKDGKYILKPDIKKMYNIYDVIFRDNDLIIKLPGNHKWVTVYRDVKDCMKFPYFIEFMCEPANTDDNFISIPKKLDEIIKRIEKIEKDLENLKNH